MVEYSLKLSGKIVEILIDGLVCQSKKDGLTQLRDKLAFDPPAFQKGDDVTIEIKKITDNKIYSFLLRHSNQTWRSKTGVTWYGVVNSVGHGAFDLKKLDSSESPFKRVFFWQERSWIANDTFLDELPVEPGDVIRLEVKKIGQV